MPLISFSGTTSRGPFWKLIIHGEKTQTCRKPRKRPVKLGDKLYLYWKCRVPKSKKPIHKIGEAICTKVERMKYQRFANSNDFARRDGFRDFGEMQQWFGDPQYNGNEEYNVIHFKLKPRRIYKSIQDALEHHAVDEILNI